MSNLRYTTDDDPILVAVPGHTYLGGLGNDLYIIDPHFVQEGGTININDRAGDNVIHLVGGLNIAASQLATLTSGVTQMELTLNHGTRLFIEGASDFAYRIGGATAGAEAQDCTFAQVIQALGYTGVPAAGDSAQATDAMEMPDDGRCGSRIIRVDASTPPSEASAADYTFDIQPGEYTHPISHFGAGDRLVFPEGNAPTLSNDNFTDGTVTLNWAEEGQVVRIVLTGLSTSEDAQLLGLSDFTTVFGDAALG